MFIRSPKKEANISSNENQLGPMFDSTLQFFLVSRLSHFIEFQDSSLWFFSADLSLEPCATVSRAFMRGSEL